MNRKQRKRHAFIWVLIALLFIGGTIPVFRGLSLDHSIPPASLGVKAQLPSEWTRLGNDAFSTCYWMASADSVGHYKIRVELITPYAAASSVLYADSRRLGRIGSRGSYQFSVDSLPAVLLVYDELRNTELSRIPEDAQDNTLNTVR